ncbi:homolog to archaease [Natronomonas pharaonis DSM 2160]|uniref:Homolog to archaease n=1 Tax=Natronomonas pharaonis (strain ATCC 35678 / DSM 2160 / CIP 103997 / JCM 8858 / NBRC 14720 / NCIMB 2260 / Gabara) TaxID=348780 RepID=A0A1U7EY01_NATPD|nr:archease [Natronomonas pharaonis]CAI50084.1 homolog to archaease [Natronomonas pharaonis DSM 2160]
MGYELRDHTADIAVAATGATLDAVFAAVADGLSAAHCETWPDDRGDRVSVAAAAESREALLFEYLAELIYQRDVRGVLPVDHELAVEEDAGDWQLEGSARGVPLDAITAREIKAVTYSEMELTETEDGWRAYVVFDV